MELTPKAYIMMEIKSFAASLSDLFSSLIKDFRTMTFTYTKEAVIVISIKLI